MRGVLRIEGAEEFRLQQAEENLFRSLMQAPNPVQSVGKKVAIPAGMPNVEVQKASTLDPGRLLKNAPLATCSLTFPSK